MSAHVVETDLYQRFETHLFQSRLFSRPSTVLLAVSGGADSMVLLDLVHRVHGKLGLRCVVGHVNHGIREASPIAERLAERAAEGAGFDVLVERLALGAGASETAARAARYRALWGMAGRVGASAIVTGHHRDDQVETVLFRVLRGSGVAGLSGIGTSFGGVVRPLLPFSRAELRAYAVARKLSFEDDPSNVEPRHARSWIRTELLPVLRTRFGVTVDEDILRTASSAQVNREAWDAVLDRLGLGVSDTPGSLSANRWVLDGLPEALRTTVLQALARRAGFTLTQRGARGLARVLDGVSGRVVELGGGWVAEIAFDVVRLHRARKPETRTEEVIGDEGEARWADWRLRWRTGEAPVRLARDAMETWVSSVEGLRWRSPSPGDRIRPLGGTGRRSVHRLLMEARIPRSLRSLHPMLVCESDPIWLPGVCRSADRVPGPGRSALWLAAQRVDA